MSMSKFKRRIGECIPNRFMKKRDQICFCLFALSMGIFFPIFLLLVKAGFIRVFALRSERIGHLVPDSVEMLEKCATSKALINAFFCKGAVSNSYWIKIIKESDASLQWWQSMIVFYFWVKLFGCDEMIDHCCDNMSRVHSNELISPSVANLLEKAQKKIHSDASAFSNFVDTYKPFEFIVIGVRNEVFSVSNLNMMDGAIDHHAKRNSDIQLFRQGVSELLLEGYKVVRVGREGPALDIIHENFLDYVTFNGKHDILDVYLHAFCRGNINTCFGPNWISAVFDRPLLHINVADTTAFFSSHKVMMAPKLLRDLRTNKFVEFERWFELMKPDRSVKDLKSREQLELLDIPSDILAMIILEFNKFCDGGWLPSSANSDIRSRVLKLKYMKNLVRTFGLDAHFVLSNCWVTLYENGRDDG